MSHQSETYQSSFNKFVDKSAETHNKGKDVLAAINPNIMSQDENVDIIDGFAMVSFESYEDLMVRKIRESETKVATNLHNFSSVVCSFFL